MQRRVPLASIVVGADAHELPEPGVGGVVHHRGAERESGTGAEQVGQGLVGSSHPVDAGAFWNGVWRWRHWSHNAFIWVHFVLAGDSESAAQENCKEGVGTHCSEGGDRPSGNPVEGNEIRRKRL